MSTSIVVTGATGHLGRLIIERLIARGTAPGDIVAPGQNAERLAAVAHLGYRPPSSISRAPQAWTRPSPAPTP